MASIDWNSFLIHKSPEKRCSVVCSYDLRRTRYLEYPHRKALTQRVTEEQTAVVSAVKEKATHSEAQLNGHGGEDSN